MVHYYKMSTYETGGDGEVTSVNSQKGDVVLTAADINFTDGENFQQKLDGGKLKGDIGPVGPKGEQGPIGPSGKDGAEGKQGPAGKDGKDATPAIATLTTASVELANNTIYRADKLASLTFTLPAALLIDSLFDAEIDITIGASPMQVTAPAAIDWQGDDIVNGAWTPTENKRYVLYIYWDGVRFRAISQSQKVGA